MRGMVCMFDHLGRQRADIMSVSPPVFSAFTSLCAEVGEGIYAVVSQAKAI